jgi:uncharacterized membrane protein YhaH (DUF805 family)
MDGYLTAMRRYIEFGGRSGRYEFWMFMLFYLILGAIAAALDVRLLHHPVSEGTGTIGAVITLIHFIPSLAVGVRRLHDTERSGWWMLLILLPLIGIIWLIVLWCFEGTLGSNDYGPGPRSDDMAPAPAFSSPRTFRSVR